MQTGNDGDEAMQINGIDNVFFGVVNLDRALAFYQQFGFKPKLAIPHLKAMLLSIGEEEPGLILYEGQPARWGKLWVEVADASQVKEYCLGIGVEGKEIETGTGKTYEIVDESGNVIGFADYSKKPELARCPISRYSADTIHQATRVNSSVIIREALSEDLDQIISLLGDDEFGEQREDQTDLAAYKAVFDAILNDPNHYILVMEKDGELVGCVQVSYLPNLTFKGSWRAQFEGIRIRSNHRGSGLGKQLLKEAIARSKTRGCRVIQLTTHVARPEAIAFYESLGFTGTHLGMKLYI